MSFGLWELAMDKVMAFIGCSLLFAVQQYMQRLPMAKLLQ
jgi:hypothetical protein